MDWELTKENCVPVRAGRSKAALQELAKDSAADALEAKRRELWQEVVDYTGEDVLEPWQKYIKWMQEYGVGGGKADLQKVLEACTKELQQHPRYMHDVRYLRIWIQYADCLPDPGDVFLFLKEKGIGQDFALYYEACATYYELRGNFQAADAVYLEGVKRNAKPLERLKGKHEAFTQRMAQRIQRKIQEEAILGPAPPEPPLRSSLATLGAPRGTRPRQAAGQQQPWGGVFGTAAPPAGGGLFAPSSLQPQKPLLRPALAVAADDEFVGPGPESALPGFSTMPQVNNLRELKPYNVIRKENMDRPLAWSQAAPLAGPSGAGPAGAAAPVRGPAGGLEIFTDEEFQEEDEWLGPNSRRSGDGAAAGAGGEAAGKAQPAAPGPLSFLPLGGGSSLLAQGGGLLSSSLAPPAARGAAGGVPLAPPGALALKFSALGAGGGGASLGGGGLAGVWPLGQAQPQPAEAAVGLTALPQAGSSAGLQAAQGSGTAAGQAGGGTAGRATEDREGGPGRAHPDEEEMSYEELRAAEWFRRNPHVRPAGERSQVAPASVGASAAAATAAAAEALGGMCIDSPVASPRHASATSHGTGTASTSGQQHAPTAAVAKARPVKRAPLGVIAAAPPESSIPESILQSLSGDPAPAEQAPAGPLQPPAPAKRRPLADAAGPAPGVGALLGAGPATHAPPPSSAPAAPDLHAQHQLAAPAAPPHPGAGTMADPGPGHGRGAASASEPDASCSYHDNAPTVTISTKGAFDLLNSMFSDDLPHQQARKEQRQVQQQPEQRQERRQPLAACTAPPAAAPAPLVPPAPAHAPPVAAAPEPAPLPAAAAAAAAPPAAADGANEPTVTLHTRLAFDALNDMFNDTLPHEAARKLGSAATASGAAACPSKPITSSDVRRLANASRAGAAPGPAPGMAPAGAFTSSFSSVAGSAPSFASMASVTAAFQPPSLAIHEDTFFLPTALPGVCGGPGLGGAGSGASASGSLSGSGRVPFGATGAAAAGGAGGPEVAGAAAGAGPGPGAVLYEDTEFIAQPLRGAGGLPGGTSGRAPVGPMLHEDTEFVTRSHGQMLAAAGPGPGAGQYGGGAGVAGVGVGGGGAGALGGRGVFGGSGQGVPGRGAPPLGGAGLVGRGAAGGGGAGAAAAARPAVRPRGGALQVLED